MATEEVICPACNHKEVQEIPENMTNNQAYKLALKFKCKNCGWHS